VRLRKFIESESGRGSEGAPVPDSRLTYTSSAAARAALADIGRTEDVAVSPDGTRLALAAFNRNEIYVFVLAIVRDGNAVTIDVPDHVVLTSSDFRQPHGVTFLDSDHLLVCNRGGDVNLVPVPRFEASVGAVEVPARRVASGQGFLRATVKTPGSAAVDALDAHRFRVLVCSDQWHFVTSHVVTLGDHTEVVDEGIRIEAPLEIPDGISFSPDHAWIAISNHVQGNVQLFRNAATLNRASPPDVILDGSVCPHGLSFDAAGDLYVADAASPYIHRYQRPPEGWRNQSAPTCSLRMLDDETFFQGRYAAREGGVKGIHIDQGTDVLITTHHLGALEFHDLRLLRLLDTRADPDQLAALRRDRDAEIELTKSDVTRRRWNLRTRLRKEVGAAVAPLRANARAVVPYLGRMRLEQINRWSKRSLLEANGPIVSMTSHSIRISHAHLAIESIAQGSVRPKRMMLWLPNTEAGKPLPATLERLVRRGLEIHYVTDLGPHTKYFPYVSGESEFRDPLVTADDDIIYPRHWLASLVDAHRQAPRYIHCHRARRIRFDQGHFAPYWAWPAATERAPHPLNFLIGASGVIYPPAFLRALKDSGTAFMRACPSADDIWLNFVAYRHGFAVAQLSESWPGFSDIPASQAVSLSRINIGEGANQLQLARTYRAADRQNLARSAHVVGSN